MDIRSGFSWASLLAWVALVAMAIYLIFVATHKTDAENYAKGSEHTETTFAPVQNIYPLAIPGCETFMRVDTPTGSKVMNLSNGKEVKK